MLLQQASILRTVHAGYLAGLQRSGADRVLGDTGEQQCLGKGFAGTNDFHQLFLTIADHPVQLYLAAEDEIETIGLVTLVEQRGTRRQASEVGRGAHLLQRRIR
ncbi:hypothetical protein D3C80_1369890 [compost metagenome]